MSWLSKITFLARSLFSQRKLDEQLSEEIQTHVDMATEANVAKGMSRDEARYAALREFGNVASIQEETRDEHGWVWLEQIWKDIGFAVRSFVRARGFTLAMLATLAVGIAVAMASVNLTAWVLFHRWPFPHPEQLVQVIIREGPNTVNAVCAGIELRSIQEQTNVFSELAAAEQSMANVTISGVPVVANILNLTSGCDRTLSVRPAQGRGFLPEEYRVGANPVAVISDLFWRKKMHASPEVLGQTIMIDQQPHVIVGVLSAEQILFPGLGDIFRPMAVKIDPQQPFSPLLFVIGRLNSGVTRSQAVAALATVKVTGLPQWAEQYFAARKPDLQDLAFYPTKPYWLLLGAGMLLYVSACLNALNLTMARLLGRKRELGIRLALGGSRWQIARLLLVESMVLALTAGFLVTLAWRLMLPLLETMMQGSENGISFNGKWWQINWEILGLAVGWSMVVGAVVAVVPVVRLLRGDLSEAIKECGMWHGEGRKMGRLRQALVVLQASFAVILLIGAGLMMSSFEKMRRLNLGFDRSGKVNVAVLFPQGYDPPPEGKLQLFERLTQRLAELPGVKEVAYADTGLLGGEWLWEQLTPPDGAMKRVGGYYVGPDFARVAGLTVVQGRWFEVPRGKNTDRIEVVINQTMARQMFGDSDPIGQLIPQRPWLVVGVVRDVKGDLRQPVGPHYYAPAALVPNGIRMLILRVDGDMPPELTGHIQRAVYSVDPRLIVPSVVSLEQTINGAMWSEQIAYRTLRFLSSVALGLAVIGLFSVLACNVATRTREFGVRMALGAAPGELLRLVLRRGVGAAAAGVVIGSITAVGLTRFMESLLFETSPTDPMVYLAVAAMLLTAATAACWLPARRAAKVDPVIALRAE